LLLWGSPRVGTDVLGAEFFELRLDRRLVVFQRSSWKFDQETPTTVWAVAGENAVMARTTAMAVRKTLMAGSFLHDPASHLATLERVIGRSGVDRCGRRSVAESYGR
jgi:hypothetical protein